MTACMGPRSAVGACDRQATLLVRWQGEGYFNESHYCVIHACEAVASLIDSVSDEQGTVTVRDASRASSPVVPSVGAVPVEVPEEAVEAALMALVEAHFLPTPVDQFRRAQQIALAGAYPLIAARVRAETIAELSAVEAAEGDPDVAEMRRWANQTPDRYARDAVLAAADAVERAQRASLRVRAEERQRIDALIADRLTAASPLQPGWSCRWCWHRQPRKDHHVSERPLSVYPIQVLTKDELRTWRDGVHGAAAQAAKLSECGYVPLAFLNDGWFTWLCPGCGYFSHGRVGEQPVGGWNEPRWTVTGMPDSLTLQPSLGCPRWRDGVCAGHWWCRSGELVQA